jgi:DNA-binding response OmpR family regulator
VRRRIGDVRILVIEDEHGIADFVERALRSQGHTVSLASDGLQGERLALTTDVDLVILDGRLPGRDGLDVVRGIRAMKPALPVIMLTARGEVADRVAGLDAGATDYLAKPFAVEELLARVRAHLRAPAQSAPSTLAAADIAVDLLTRAVTRQQREVRLSAKEFDLLAYFLRHPNQVLSREQLLSGVWGYDHDPQTNIVEVYVGYLRRKLRIQGSPEPIQTVRSVGYRLVAA